MSDWRPQQGPGKFRGVPFHIATGERAGGRFNVTHEVPKSETVPFTDDMGRKGQKFTVECYVLGTDYMTARDALLTALERPGPGELVHPYFGTKWVAAVDWRMRQESTSGGLARFSIDFVETATAAKAPTSTPDAAALASAAAAAATSAVSANFLQAFNAAATFRTSVVGVLRRVSVAVNKVLDAKSLLAQQSADLVRQVQSLTADATALLNAPADLLTSQVALFNGLKSAFLAIPGSFDASAALLNLYFFDPDTRPPGAAPLRAVEQANFDAVHRLVQRLVIVNASEAVVAQMFTSFDQAVAARTAVTDLIDLHVEEASDDTYPALVALHAALVAAVPGDSATLPKLQPYTPVTTVPSLVLAHQLYGHLDREADLVTRNRVRHPGFVTGGVGLEVLDG